MQNFNTSDYEKMIGELIHDTFYVDLSNRGKIKGIRQFSEVLVRKILDIGNDKKLMLGQLEYKFNDKLNMLQDERKGNLLEIISRIVRLGNDSTHTQRTDEFTEDELNQVIDGMFDLYAYMFIDYFLKYPMHLFSPRAVLKSFSLLPPIIRYKTLKYLYEREPNLQIANRYSLSIIKTYGKNESLSWLTKEKDKLISMSYPTEAEMEKCILASPEVSPGLFIVSIDLPRFDNVYDLLKSKIEDPNTSINEKGKLYSNFEEAKKHYEMNKILTSDNIEGAKNLYKRIKQRFSNNIEEVRRYYEVNHLSFPENGEKTFDELEEFGILMDFVFMGRTGQ